MNQVPSPINFAALLEMLGGGEQILASLLSKFAEALTSDLAASEQAMVDHDAEALRRVAHRVKGTSAMRTGRIDQSPISFLSLARCVTCSSALGVASGGGDSATRSGPSSTSPRAARLTHLS